MQKFDKNNDSVLSFQEICDGIQEHPYLQRWGFSVGHNRRPALISSGRPCQVCPPLFPRLQKKIRQKSWKGEEKRKTKTKYNERQALLWMELSFLVRALRASRMVKKMFPRWNVCQFPGQQMWTDRSFGIFAFQCAVPEGPVPQGG